MRGFVGEMKSEGGEGGEGEGEGEGGGGGMRDEGHVISDKG